MSLFRSITEKVPTPECRLATSHSKMVSKDEIIRGEIVTTYEFGEASFENDPRKDLTIHDLSLSNVKRLGRLQDLKEVTLQRDDVDKVIDSLNSMQNEPAEVSSETAQKR